MAMTDFRTYEERLKYIEYLAKFRMTGTSKDLAKRFDVSTRTAKRMISYLRNKGVNIRFDEFGKTYFIDE
jgi:predicted DNA-binding transcriptional regulator YafY